MPAAGAVEPEAVRDYFARIEPELWRFPAIDPRAFQPSVEERSGRRDLPLLPQPLKIPHTRVIASGC